MKSDTVTVLDLGSSKITCLVASSENDGSMSVLAVATTPCKGMQRGVVSDLDETSRAIDLVVRRVSEALPPETIGDLVVGIGGGTIEGMNGRGFKPIVPPGRHVTHQDVMEVIHHSRSVVLAPERELIQALPREFRIDGEPNIHQPLGKCGRKLEVDTYLVTADRQEVQTIERAVGMGGRKVDHMVLQPLASGVGVLSPDEMELGAAVVDIGGSLTNVAVFAKGSIAFSATLPIGSRHVTSDLANLLKTSLEEAERLKTHHGSALAKVVPAADSVDVLQVDQSVPRPLQRRVLCEIIESRMREIATMAWQQIEKSGLDATLQAGIVLTGGGSLLPATEKLFEETLKNARVRTVEPLPVSGLPNTPGLATAVGIARFALTSYDELSPAAGIQGWKDKVKTLFSMVTGN